MKFIVLLSFLAVVFASADPPAEYVDPQAAIKEFVVDQEPKVEIKDDGSFVLSLVDKDGSKYEEEGLVLVDELTGEDVVISEKGTFSYPGKDGELTKVAYIGGLGGEKLTTKVE